MKNILLACPQTQIDTALRRCLAHLVSSCQIDIAHNGYQALEALNLKAFDLIMVDFTLPDIDSLELADSVQYIDPGVPVVLIIPQAYQPIAETALKQKVYPIIRPFKPLSFLRLVDQLLHQYLNRYRHLAQTLADNLDRLRVHLHATASFLVDDSGRVMTAAGTLPEPVLESLAQLLVQWHQDTGAAAGQPENLLADPSTEAASGIYYAAITENLFLAVVASSSPHAPQPPGQIWLLLKQVAADIRKAFKLYIGVTTGMLTLNQPTISYHFISYELIAPLLAAPASKLPSNDEDEVTINWQIISRESGVLNRLHEFCRITKP